MSPIPRWLSSPPPSAALEIDARGVTAAVVSRQGGARVLAAHVREPLPPGVVEPALNAANVHDPAALASAIRAALDRLTPRPRRIALVLPDTVAKFSLIRFEKVPAKAQDLDQLIRWQIRKSAPFRIEEAQVAWIPGTTLGEGGREFLVTVARRDVIESYEAACAAAGAHPGVVDLASLNLVNAVLALAGEGGSEADWLLVHVAAGYATVAIVRAGTVIFVRTRAAGGAAAVEDLVHQTAMYHEDRLGGGAFPRVVLAGASGLGGEAAERLRRGLEQRLAGPVTPLDFTGAVALRDRIAPSPDLLDALAPAVGALLREQVA